MRKRIPVILIALVALAPAGRAAAQAPAMERLTFDQAVQRAIERNPSAAMAAAQILRAEAVLAQVRASTRLAVNGTVTSTTLNTGVSFDGNTVVPRSQLTGSIDVTMPLYAPALWASRTQAMDQRAIADLSATETRRQVALAAADLYLAVIASHRGVEANERAQDTARAHYDYAHTQLQAGTGSLLNELRAQQELSTDAVLVESSRTALYQAQEALGVLLATDRPVDTAGEPAFDVPAPDAQPPTLSDIRPDLKLYFAQQRAAARVVSDSGKDWLPSLQGIFQPSIT
jgi:outer membrane protein